MMTVSIPARAPMWFWAVALFGLAWNIFGVWQFMGSLGATTEGLMMGGMTAEQARVYKSLPGWATLAFAGGTFGGVIGCLALIARRALAVPVFAVSLAAYLALFWADWSVGLFAVLPGQMAILSFVVAVAVALLAAAIVARRSGVLVQRSA